MAHVEATLEGVNAIWKSGQHIIDVTLQLGQNDRGNTVEITLADPGNLIANKLINHSLRTGGIVGLPEPPSASTSGSTNDAPASTMPTPVGASAWEKAIVQGCIRYGVTDHNQIAYILATAQAETTMGANLTELSSGQQYEGRRDLGNVNPGDGVKYKGRGLVQLTGRTNYSKFSSILGVDLINNPNLMTQPDLAVKALVIGMQRGSFTGRKLSDYINGSSVDFVNARRIVNALDKATIIANSAQNTYLPKVQSLLQQAGAATSTIQDKPAVTPAPSNSADSTALESTVKGNKLTVSILGTTFEFFHQGTETSHQGTTKITGQGIRWVLNRRKRNKTEKGLKLSELTKKVATSHKLKAEYLADVDPIYVHINQQNITDYQLLKRECDRAGLFLSESKGVLTVKSLRSLKDSTFVLELGKNLMTYSIKDAAIDTYRDDAGSALLQADAKVELNPITGQFEQKRVDIDTTKDSSSTGKDKTDTSGTLVPGQDALVNASKARTKRVKGLPSSFTIPLTEETLQIEPLFAIRTKGLPSTFNRVWLVDSIRHSVAAGTTTIDCYSPVEVIAPADSQPVSQNAAQGSTQVLTTATNGGFIWGTKGLVTSAMGSRIAPLPGASSNHGGTDIGAPVGTPVVAGKAGVVITAAYAGNAGNLVTIKHDQGYTTLYMHLHTIMVKLGQQVQQGQQIGTVGNTGNSTGAHLHYEIRRNGQKLAPQDVGLRAVKKGDTVSY